MLLLHMYNNTTPGTVDFNVARLQLMVYCCIQHKIKYMFTGPSDVKLWLGVADGSNIDRPVL